MAGVCCLSGYVSSSDDMSPPHYTGKKQPPLMVNYRQCLVGMPTKPAIYAGAYSVYPSAPRSLRAIGFRGLSAKSAAVCEEATINITSVYTEDHQHPHRWSRQIKNRLAGNPVSLRLKQVHSLYLTKPTRLPHKRFIVRQRLRHNKYSRYGYGCQELLHK